MPRASRRLRFGNATLPRSAERAWSSHPPFRALGDFSSFAAPALGRRHAPPPQGEKRGAARKSSETLPGLLEASTAPFLLARWPRVLVAAILVLDGGASLSFVLAAPVPILIGLAPRDLLARLEDPPGG